MLEPTSSSEPGGPDASHALAAAALEHGEPVVVMDEQWRVALTTRGFETLSGLRREALVGRRAWEVFPEGVGPDEHCRGLWEQARETREPVSYQRYFPHWRRWLDVSVYPSGSGVSIFFRDITEKRPAAPTLEASGQRLGLLGRLESRDEALDGTLAAPSEAGADPDRPLHKAVVLNRAVLENALDAVVGMDSEGRVVDWNAQAESLFGWSRQEALGCLMADLLIPAPARQGHHDGLQRFIAGGEGRIVNKRVEVTALRRDGETFPVELSVTPLPVAGEHLFYAFVRDLSEQKAVERERQAVIERLEHTVSLNETFYSVLAHDLRTPLSAILMNAELLRRRGADFDPKRAGAQIAASGERMGRMIEQLLDVSRARIGGGLLIESQTTDLERVCREGITEVITSTPECNIEFESRGDCVGVWDADRLLQVVWNLVGNAVSHSEGACAVQVRLDGGAADAVELSVCNAGGIPAELLPVLFEPFEHFSKGGRGRRGLGLGLYITREIVQGHGGTILVDSDATRGTRFLVKLPRH